MNEMQHFQNILDATRTEFEREQQTYTANNSQLAKQLSSVTVKLSEMEKKLAAMMQENVLLRSKNTLDQMNYKKALKKHLEILEKGFSFKIDEILHMFNKVREREGLELKHYGRILLPTHQDFARNDQHLVSSAYSKSANVTPNHKSILKGSGSTPLAERLPVEQHSSGKRSITFENGSSPVNSLFQGSPKDRSKSNYNRNKEMDDNNETRMNLTDCNESTNTMNIEQNLVDKGDMEEQRRKRRKSSRRESLFSAEEFGFAQDSNAELSHHSHSNVSDSSNAYQSNEKHALNTKADLSVIASQHSESEDQIALDNDDIPDLDSENKDEAQNSSDSDSENEVSDDIQNYHANGTSFSLIDATIPEDSLPQQPQSQPPIKISAVPTKKVTQDASPPSLLAVETGSASSSQESRKSQVYNDEEDEGLTESLHNVNTSQSQQLQQSQQSQKSQSSKDASTVKILHSMKSKPKNKSITDDVMPSTALNSKLSLSNDAPLPGRSRRTRKKTVDYTQPSLRAKMRRPTEKLVDATTFTDIHELQVKKRSISSKKRKPAKITKAPANGNTCCLKFALGTCILGETTLRLPKSKELLFKLAEDVKEQLHPASSSISSHPDSSGNKAIKAKAAASEAGKKNLPLMDITPRPNSSASNISLPLKSGLHKSFNADISNISNVSMNKTKRLLKKPVINILDGLDKDDDENDENRDPRLINLRPASANNRMRINEDDLAVFDILDSLDIKKNPKTHKKYSTTKSTKKLFIR
ncbi:hypothetical protein ACO0QE_004754 [Hanseniaspora vineae]